MLKCASYMVGPHGVPWPAFRSALPGSHCWKPVVVLASTGTGGRGSRQGLYHPPTPALGKHPRTFTQKNLACTNHPRTHLTCDIRAKIIRFLAGGLNSLDFF